MKLPRRKFLHLSAGAAALITVTSMTFAQDWPTRPVPSPVGVKYWQVDWSWNVVLREGDAVLKDNTANTLR